MSMAGRRDGGIELFMLGRWIVKGGICLSRVRAMSVGKTRR